MATPESVRRRKRRFIGLIVLLLALAGGWSAFWFYAAHKAELAIAGWRAREAAAGRVYTCGKQTLNGFPFRIEVDCAPAAAHFKSGGVPIAVTAKRTLVVAQIYSPDLLIAEVTGPLTVAEGGKAPELVATWKQAYASVGGNPLAPQRVAMVFDNPTLARAGGAGAGAGTAPQPQDTLLKADHMELHGRIVGGSVWHNPVIELALSMQQASLAALPAAAAATPVDGEIVATLHGLDDFSPKPWAERFREIQKNNGYIEINRSRVTQGETLAVGAGKLSLTPDGYLQGKLTVTAAGLEHFLNAIGANMAVQKSPEMDKVAGFLDKLSPGLGQVAREQVGSHLTFGVKAIEGNSKLEGKPAVTLPLNLEHGAVSLGPIPFGQTPKLF